MPILNDSLTLDQFNAGFVYFNKRLCDFFIGKRAMSRVLLPAGHRLWKCTSYPLINARGGVTEWWTAGSLLPACQQASKSLGVTLRDYARARYAVAEEWNDLRNLLQIELMQPVYAFSGMTRGVSKNFAKDARGYATNVAVGNITLIGGDGQYSIPHLTPSYVRQISCTPSDV